MGKRILSLLLAMVMVVSMVPAAAIPTLAAETEQTASYDALVAANITLDGNLSETDWLTSGKLSGGQAFDILWDGENLYFAVVAGETDTALTVTVGETTLLTAEKAAGASAIEAKAAYTTKGVTTVQDVTLTVGESTWTGNVNLVKYSRTTQITTASLGGNVNPTAYEKGWDFSVPAAADNTTADYRSYALQTSVTTLSKRSNGIRFECAFDPTEMTAHSGADQSASGWTANAGFNSVLIGPNKERIVFGIDNIEGTGLVFIIQTATWGQRATYNLGRTAEDGVFYLGLEWTADGVVKLYVDGCYRTSFTDKQFVHSSESTTNALIVEARRFRSFNATPVDFKVYDVVLSLPAEVEYPAEPGDDEIVTATGTYDAFVASDITLDGNLEELAWRTGAELGKGQPFDILFDGNNLYFGVVAADGDQEMTVKIGEETVATAAKSGNGFEAKVEYLTKNVTTVEDVTITVGNSVWTGNVNLVRMARMEQLEQSEMSCGAGANATGTVTATADGNGIVFDLPARAAALTTTTGAVGTLYAMKSGTKTLVDRTNNVAFEFTLDSEELPVVPTGQVGVDNTVWAGFEVILVDSTGNAVRFAIGNAEEGFFLRSTTTKADKKYVTNEPLIQLGKTAEDGAFDVKVVWKTDESIEVFVDGVSKGSVENAETPADIMAGSSYTVKNMAHIRATRYDYNAQTYYQYPVKFSVINAKLSKAVEVKSVTPDDGEMNAAFSDVEPAVDFNGWTAAPQEYFAAGEGTVSALVYNQKVYVRVDAEGAVSVTLGAETKTAESSGSVILAFDETTVSQYGQEIALSVSVDGTAVWEDQGKLTVAQSLVGGSTAVLESSKGVIKSNRTTVDADSNSFTMTSAAEEPMYDNSHKAYWIYNKADLADTFDTGMNILLEQTVRIDEMPIGDVTGTFEGDYINRAWGYHVLFEHPSAVTAGQYDSWSGVIYPDAEGELYMLVKLGTTGFSAPIALGKNLKEAFKLGMLCRTDGAMTVYVDGEEVANLSGVRGTGAGVYKTGIMLAYMDPVTKTEGKETASMFIQNVTVSKLGSKELIDLEDEITQAAIFGSADLNNVTMDLGLPTVFRSAYLGTHTLSWTSSNEEVVEADGTVHVAVTTDGKATLSAYLDGSDKALWSVDVTVPASAVALNALLSEETITVDGKLTEMAWLDWLQFGSKVPGNMAAAWTKGNVYFAVYSQEADTLKMTVNDKEITVDLATAAVTGVTGATAARNAETGTVEICIPLTAVGFNLTDYNQSVDFSAKLYKGETESELQAILLNFSGDVAELQPLASYTKDNGPWTLLTNSINYDGYAPGKRNYAYKTSNAIDNSNLFILSHEFQFDALPGTTGAQTTASQADGFHYYFSNEDATRYGTTIFVAIFNDGGETLKLRIGQGEGQTGYVFDLGKTLGEKFRITYYWYPNNSLDIFVDGVLIGTVEDAGYATSYLGIGVICYNYWSAKEDASAELEFTISNQTTITKKYDNVQDELTQNAVFGRVDLDHVQKDLPMVTSFASANFAALNLKWTSSDPSVVAVDGTVTRHPTEAKSSTITVYYIDADDNKVKLWDVTVTVDPLSVTKQPAPSIIHTGFAAPGSIKVDGVVEAEESWLLNGWVVNAENQQAVGYFGAQWDQENLYILLDTEAENVSVNVADEDISVEKTGAVTELKIPVADLGRAKIEEYGVVMDITVTMDGSTYEGELNLTNVDWWGTDNVHAGLPMLANNVKSVKMGTADVPDGNQGAKQLENGWRLYDLYGGEDAANPAGIRTYVLFMKMPVYENFADRTEATQIEFDFYAKALPEWEWDEAIKADIGRAFANYGVTFSLSDKANAAKNSNVAVFGIVNTADEGLVLVVNRGTEDYERFVLNKQVGEEFRIGMTWLTNANLVLTIDGEEITTIRDMSKFVNSVGDTSFVVNMLRNKEKPTSTADDMDVYLTNIAFGKAHSDENIIRNLTFADFGGENESADKIQSDLELPAYMTNGQLDHQYPITWTSSDETVIDPETGKVTRPERGVKLVTMTATLAYTDGATETKEFTLTVFGTTVSNGNSMVVTDDTNPFGKAAQVYTGVLFQLDKTNNSIVYAFPEGEDPTQINLITLTDLDEISRLNRESLRLFVSDDNATYTEIEDYKLHHDGCNWYLYDFVATARYIKVHYTHRDQDDSDFINTPGEMISVSWDESLVVPGDAAETAVPATSLRDQAVAITLPDGITAEGLRVALNGEILFHYVDTDGTVYVRIADPTSGTLKLWNTDGIELADKENVYEVTYGTRETLPASGRWVLGMKAGQTFPDGSSLDVDTLYHMSGKSVKKSTDGGYTWTNVGAVSHDTALSSGGWGIDSKTGRLFHEFYGPTSFSGADITASVSVTFVFYSDDGGKTWTKASGLGKVEGDVYSNYVLSYTDITELAGNDGAGDNVDFVFPMGAQYNNNGAFCGRVAYTRDGGLTWHYSDSKITFGNETAFEGGVSEATILEREDGTLVYYARCQSSGVDNFTISYSLDHGVTWLTPGAASSIYTTNTQALMMTYDFGGFDGDRTTGSPIFMWGGNNVLGGSSYMRMPLNFAVSTNEMDTFRNIQNIFSETFMDVYDFVADHYITNPSIQQINGDDMYLAFSRLREGDSIYMVVNDFTDWFTRTKGAYDSFESGNAQYEGWVAAKGSAVATKVETTVGSYAMAVTENTQVTRSIPYLQNGKLSIDLYVDADSNFVFELQPAFSNVEQKCAVISAEVKGTTMTLHDGTVLTLKFGWNTVSFELELTENKASVSINGGKLNAVQVNTQFNGNTFDTSDTVYELGNYIAYVTILANSNVYVDEFFVESSLDAVTDATEADKQAANNVINAIVELEANAQRTDTQIAAVKNAYNALSQVQKDLVKRNVRKSAEDTAITAGSDLTDYMINYYDVLMSLTAAEKENAETSTYVDMMSLALNGNIDVYFWAKISDAALNDGVKMVIALPNGEVKEILAEDDLKATWDDEEYYKFACEVPAKEMADDIYVKLVNATNGDVLFEKNYRAKDYAEKLVAEGQGEAYEQAKPAAVALLNYAAYAQHYFAHNDSHLANTNLTGASAEAYNTAFSEVKASDLAASAVTVATGKAVTLYSVSLILESETTMRLFFKIADGVDPEDVKFNGKKYDGKRDDRYYVDIKDIAAQDLDDMVTVTITHGSETYSVQYAPMTYCYNVLNSASAKASLKDVATALYLYNKAATEYAGN